MKTKSEILYAQERNIQNIFEAVTIKFFKKIVPDVEMGDSQMLSIMENAFGTKDFEEFKEKFENQPLGKFIVDITEQLQDVNLFRFEAMEEHIAIEESENPYMIQKELYDGLDSEFEELVLTDNIKNKVADIIKCDIETSEENAKKEAELVDDLDNIDPDSDEFDPDAEPVYDGEEETGTEDTMKDENADAEVGAIEEAAWAKVNITSKDIESNDFDMSISKLIKDDTMVEVDVTTKKDIQVKLHNLAIETASSMKGMVTPDYMKQLKGMKANEAQAKYYAWMMTKGCDQTLNNYLAFILGLIISIAAGTYLILAGLTVVGIIVAFSFSFMNSKRFTDKTLPRLIVMTTLGASIAVKLQDMKNKTSDIDEKNKLETIRNEFMAKAKITEMDCSEYRGMTEEKIKGNLSLITESYQTSFTGVLEEIVSDLSEDGEISESLTQNAQDIAIMATSMMLVKELFLEPKGE